ncbi:type VII secretion protein EccB [Microbacterium sp. NPDC058342]|uniref:type VII secretion protein EccB n=1 Tax=Microbacterium sp. NPDC058342 TaxID=3346454 RepID=UPI003656532A
MYGRRDLVDSHLFLRGRLTSAALRIDPDAPERPLRRSAVGMNVGIAIAVAAAVVVAVLNIFLFKVNDAWRDTPGALIFDESTGARYLLVEDTLHPVLNLASAALLVGGPPQVITVSADDIASVPRGPGIGEAGLPDTLPSPSVAASVWTACASDDGTTLRVAPSSDAAPIPRDEAVLVNTEGVLHLVWNGLRFKVSEDWSARALGFEPKAAREVEPRWLDTIPSGADLDLSELTIGGEGPVIGGEETQLGQLFVLTGEEAEGAGYVVTAEGLMPVTETVAALLSAIPDDELPEPQAATRRLLSSAAVVERAEWQDALPRTVPEPLDDLLTPCSVWKDGELRLAALDADAPDDAVDVAPGAGLLAATASAPGISGAALYLVSDAGMKYPVADDPTAAALGLSASDAPAIPEELLALLPTGPLIAQ